MENANETVKQYFELYAPPHPTIQRVYYEAFCRGDESFLGAFDNTQTLNVVFDLQSVLQARGIYERCLLSALVGTRTNYSGWPIDLLLHMVDLADSQRLRQAGEPFPGSGPFAVYRGVAGSGKARRVRGISWTGDFEKAKWFARRYSSELLHPDPAVFGAVVSETQVLAYTNERREDEYLIHPRVFREGVRVRRVWRPDGTDSSDLNAPPLSVSSLLKEDLDEHETAVGS